MNTNTIFYAGDHVSKLQSFSYSFSPLTIWASAGRYCSIAANVRIMGPKHGIQFVTSSEIVYREDGFFADTFKSFGVGEWDFLPLPQRYDVQIGHDVWIGQDVLLRGGITIGHGSVIAAGAVVVKDVEPYEIVGGVPAKRLRMRFDDHIVKELMASQWWLYAIPQYPHAPWGNPESLPAWLRTGVERKEVETFDSDLGSLREVIARVDGDGGAS
ncbi:CatB-related O-acetyltransferase [Sphingomonas sp. R86521]|uniref:CatB-related O-acetyltransferase n=1 Tax=Sphingomonas sp. R86521 TaxID=3093860 RepID=UPI0036D3F700